MIQQFRALHPHVRPHSHVVFLNDPFSEWDMLFIADLWFRDRTVKFTSSGLHRFPRGNLPVPMRSSITGMGNYCAFDSGVNSPKITLSRGDRECAI